MAALSKINREKMAREIKHQILVGWTKTEARSGWSNYVYGSIKNNAPHVFDLLVECNEDVYYSRDNPEKFEV